jgi:signal transduction histidine kinase
VETTVFRVAQEAVTNTVKHARAHSVVVKLAYGRRTVALLVADDGQGFAPDSDLPAPAGSWGTLGMRERAAQLGGKLFIRSADGSGTKVELRVPTRRPRGFPDRGIAGDGSGNVL